jgi:hypothetical protein
MNFMLSFPLDDNFYQREIYVSSKCASGLSTLCPCLGYYLKGTPPIFISDYRAIAMLPVAVSLYGNCFCCLQKSSDAEGWLSPSVEHSVMESQKFKLSL